ncbi:MAG: sodium-dependent transporter [Acidobacteriota bacterium]
MTQRWGTRVGLILAMAGNAVGLGNFLRFPAQAIQNGGGAFIIPYLVSFVVMGVPLLWVEWAIGRHGGQFGHHSTPGMFDRLGSSHWLKYIGVFGLFTNLCIASYYVYIESWALAYVWHSLMGTFGHIEASVFFSHYIGTAPGGLTAWPAEAIFWFLLTLVMNTWILSRGLTRGIEAAARIGMPLLIMFAIILVIRGLLLGPGDLHVVESPLAGLNFIWQPRTAGFLNPSTWLAAAGQIFFTLSLGMGSIHCYASYLREQDDIALNAASAGWLNEFVEVVLGGSLIIPISTAYLGLAAVTAATSSGSGFTLGFLTLPMLFGNWGWFAPLAGAMWFGLLFFAGVTSSLAMGQPIVTFLEDEFGLRSARASQTFGLAAAGLGLFCVVFYPSGAFDEFDFWAGTFSLVIFALAEAFVFSWIFPLETGWAEINRGAQLKIPHIFRVLIGYITPAFLLVIFLGAVFKPSREWPTAFASLLEGHGWGLSPDSVLGRVMHAGEAHYVWFNVQGMPTRDFIIDMTRVLLTLVFVGFALLVRIAWKRRSTNP